MLLTVIMPVHNAAKTLERSIKSTLFAMPRSSELLVLLDGNLPSDRKAVERVRDSRLKILSTPGRFGVAKALNILLDNSAGRFIARMDADDICLPWRFKLQLRRMVTQSLDFHFTTAVIFGSSLRPIPLIPQVPLRLGPSQIRRALCFMNPCVHPSMMATSRAIQNFRYRDLAQEDLDLWLRVAIQGAKMERSATPGILYRFHFAQITATSNWKAQASVDTEIPRLRKELVSVITSPSHGSIDEVKRLAFHKSPLLKLEHKGFPDWLKAWKDKGRS